jgi:hypothetical protein
MRFEFFPMGRATFQLLSRSFFPRNDRLYSFCIVLRGGLVGMREPCLLHNVTVPARVGGIRQVGPPLRVEERVVAEPRSQTESAARS